MSILSEIAIEEVKQVAQEVYADNFNVFATNFTHKFLPMLKRLGYEEPFIYSKEVCTILNVSERTLAHYRAKEGLPHIRGKRPFRYLRSEIYEWMKSRNKKVKEPHQDPMFQEIQRLVQAASQC